MTLVTPDQVNPGDEITASSVNTPNNQIAAVINGNIDNTNISGVNGSKITDASVTTGKLADAAVTAQKIDWPAWTSWTPTFTGFSSAPSGGTYEYCKVGSMCFVKWDMPNAGTSNSTAFTMTLPVAYTGTKPQTQLTGLVYNNGAYVFTAPGSCVINPGSPTILNLYRDFGGALWTASNGKMIPSVTISYSCAV